MARITVEDCLDSESNRFKLVRLAAQRAKQLILGSQAVTDTRGNREIVSALREIADGKVRFAKHGSSADTYTEPVLYTIPTTTENAETEVEPDRSEE
jgi:DNA-directed RNA polymerase subunit omega